MIDADERVQKASVRPCGGPFDYAVRDGVAVISDPGEFGGTPLRYEVRLRR